MVVFIKKSPSLTQQLEIAMIEQLIGMMEEISENDKFFKISAKMAKKMYDALIKQGFNEAQAIKIVAGQGSMVKGS